MDNRDSRGIQIQTHPNVDKELFRTKQHIALKNATKPFPLNTDVGVLKWRFQTQDENLIPLNSNASSAYVFWQYLMICLKNLQLIAGQLKMGVGGVTLILNLNFKMID